MEIDFDLGKRMKDRYKLRECVVVDEEDEARIRMKIAQYTARFVHSLLQEDTILGVSRGKGIYEFVKQLPFSRFPDGKVVQLSGGFFSETNYRMTPSHIVTTACEKLGSVPFFLNAPFFSPNPDTKRDLLKDGGIRKVYELADRSAVNIIGASPLRQESTVFQMGMLSREDREELASLHTVGDIAGYFIDKNGDPVQ